MYKNWIYRDWRCPHCDDTEPYEIIYKNSGELQAFVTCGKCSKHYVVKEYDTPEQDESLIGKPLD